MRTITLELLRHGPANNQLLSPLTPYLALCENHAAVTLHVPFEHNQFLYRLSSLTYKLKEESRAFELRDTARALGELLSQIPGLTAESNRQNGAGPEKDGQGGANLTHLRLIISASELALLPFELALSPNGLPGAGQHLLLQPQMPICLTREIRRVQGEQVEWPRKPKILFVSAMPPGVGSIPLDSHLLVLRRVIAPWVYYYDPADADEQRERVEDLLHVLPYASVKAIEDACASGRYTHVHILAHGVEVEENYGRRFALALHDEHDPEKRDDVRGEQLAAALRATQRGDSDGLSMPAVVTLASCDSAGVGSVAGAGASIAHALHESGIPMVVASQFPLSFEGSVRLVECLYEGLLWGKDPRTLLYDLRRRLYAQFRENHDWASLTAYVSLPPDMDEQLREVQIKQAMNSINAAMDHADVATRKMSSRYGNPEGQSHASSDELGALIKKALDKIDAAKKRLKGLLKRIPSESARINGHLASTEKRHAQAHYAAARRYLALSREAAECRKLAEKGGRKQPRRSRKGAPADQTGKARLEELEVLEKELLKKSEEHMKQHDLLLLSARDYYWESFMQGRTDSWTVVQYLSLTVVMKKSGRFEEKATLLNYYDDGEQRPAGNENEKKDPDALWSLAHLLSLYDLNNPERDPRIWAHGNLIELYLLALIMRPGEGRPDKKAAEEFALQYTDSLVDLAGRDTFEVYSTRRQILRYLEWFGKSTAAHPKLGAPEGLADLGKKAMEVADEIFKRLPEEANDKWK